MEPTTYTAPASGGGGGGGSGLQPDNNLSDVLSASASRANLGLGALAILTVSGSPSAGLSLVASSSSAATWTTPTITGQYLGSASTFAGLPTTDAAGQAASNGDWAFLSADVVGTGTTTSPQYPRGAYVYNGSAFSLGISVGADLIIGTAAGTVAAGNDSRIVGAVQTTRQVVAGTGLTGGGDLTADRTLTVAYGTTSTTAAQGNDSRFSAITSNPQSASYTLVLADAGLCVEYTGSSAGNITVPPNSSVAFPVGTIIELCQYGTGQITVVAGAGVTLRNPSSLTTRAQYSSARLRKRATDEWVISGDLS